MIVPSSIASRRTGPGDGASLASWIGESEDAQVRISFGYVSSLHWQQSKNKKEALSVSVDWILDHLGIELTPNFRDQRKNGQIIVEDVRASEKGPSRSTHQWLRSVVLPAESAKFAVFYLWTFVRGPEADSTDVIESLEGTYKDFGSRRRPGGALRTQELRSPSSFHARFALGTFRWTAGWRRGRGRRGRRLRIRANSKGSRIPEAEKCYT